MEQELKELLLDFDRRELKQEKYNKLVELLKDHIYVLKIEYKDERKELDDHINELYQQCDLAYNFWNAIADFHDDENDLSDDSYEKLRKLLNKFDALDTPINEL